MITLLNSARQSAGRLVALLAGLDRWPCQQIGQPVLETSFSTAFQRLEFRGGDLGVPPPGNQAEWRAGEWVLQYEGFLG